MSFLYFSETTLLLELNFAHEEIQYKPGDHLGVFACNKSSLVEGILQRIDSSFDLNTSIELQIQKQVHTPNGLYLPITKISVVEIGDIF